MTVKTMQTVFYSGGSPMINKNETKSSKLIDIIQILLLILVLSLISTPDISQFSALFNRYQQELRRENIQQPLNEADTKPEIVLGSN